MIPFTSSVLTTQSDQLPPAQQWCVIGPQGARLIRDPITNGITVIVPDMKANKENMQLELGQDISSSERILLETLDCRPNRQFHVGPFLTVQRRRRRRKYVRTYLFKDPTLTDDLSAYQTNFVLDRINNWGFNAFILDNATGGRPLPNLCVHLFKSYGLLEHFHLDPVIVWKLFSIIEDGYHWRNPYHNAVHAADVTQAMHCFLQERLILEKLTPLEIFSAIVAAVTHDLDHPGVNQPFLIATSNHLAALYKNSSVLENHHWRSAMGCLNESGVSSILGADRLSDVEEQIRSLVLATDITRQQEFLARLKNYLETGTLDMNSSEVRHFVLQIALKCADICNPCRPWEISRKWSMKVCEEFFRQGDYERQLNLPVTSLCDRYSSSVPKIQTGFFQFVVRPLFAEWHRMLSTPMSNDLMANLDTNKSKWDQLLEDEIIQKSQMEDISDQEESEHITVEDTDVSGTSPLARTPTFEDRRADPIGDIGRIRSVRFDTTITTASDSDNSEGDETMGRESDFLGIPRPDGRRHSIATGLMGSNIQLPTQLLSLGHSGPPRSGSSLGLHDQVTGTGNSPARVVGRTVIRRESMPGIYPTGKAQPSKIILHLQKVGNKAKVESSSPTSGPTSPGDFIENIPASPGRGTTEKSSCSSCSTEEIMEFNYSLPDNRSSGRLHHDTTDFDELCHGTSILSMSPSVAHVTLTRDLEMEDQRRHLIRQQTCPVVSLNADGSGSFNRPRFLSAAAAISPTAVASSSIITQHRQRNKSPESEPQLGTQSQSRGSGGSGGSSSEALFGCEVISEEADRQSGGSSSAEASPLEIFVKQFPPISDDNDGEPPRRESGGNLDQSDLTSSSAAISFSNPMSSGSCNNFVDFSISPGSSSPGSAAGKLLPFDEPCQDPDFKTDFANAIAQADDPKLKSNLSVSCQSDYCSVGNSHVDDALGTCWSVRVTQAGKEVDRKEEKLNHETTYGEVGSFSQEEQLNLNLTYTRAISTSTQTDASFEMENVDPDPFPFTEESEVSGTLPVVPLPGGLGPTQNQNTARLASILMWRNNRLWKSLTEEESTHDTSQPDENHHSGYYDKWDVHLTQPTQQAMMGGRLQNRRGSAPTTTPAMGSRGAQDRLSDPTQYHSSSCINSNISYSAFFPGSLYYDPSATTFATSGTKQQIRRGSVPIDLFRQTVLRPIVSNKTVLPRMGRRGSLPTDAISSESSYAYKWMHLFPGGNDDENVAVSVSTKRRSSESGVPELYAAAAATQVNLTPLSNIGAWKTQILIEQMGSLASTSAPAYWEGRRRGSLPTDAYKACSGSCSSESESSAADGSDT